MVLLPILLLVKGTFVWFDGTLQILTLRKSRIMEMLQNSILYLFTVADGRLALLKINLKEVTCDPDCDLEEVAKLTEGYSGADITNVCRYLSNFFLIQ